MNINFFILAGGYGLRAKPISNFRPKPVFPLNSIPLINIILNQLEANSVTSGYINLHYLPETLKNHIKSNLKIEYIFEEKLSGSAVLEKTQALEDGYTLVINGDIFLKIPIKELAKKIHETHADGVLLVRRDKENKYSKLSICGDKFRGISDKKTNGKMYTGIAIFKTEILKHFKDKSFFTTLKNNKFDIRILEHEDLWLDIGSPKLYYDASFKYIKYIDAENSNLISKSTNISKDSKVHGSILWNNVQVSGNSNIVNSIILDNVSINNSTISNKIVFFKDNKLTLIDL